MPCAGLQNLHPRFKSGRRLHSLISFLERSSSVSHHGVELDAQFSPRVAVVTWTLAQGALVSPTRVDLGGGRQRPAPAAAVDRPVAFGRFDELRGRINKHVAPFSAAGV